METNQRYYIRPAAAFVRSKLQKDHPENPLFELPLENLSVEDCEELFTIGQKASLKLHKFKKSIELPRVQKCLGLLSGLHPEGLLDIGTGRGVFLWPLLDQFPSLEVDCLDILEHRVQDLLAVREGGYDRLNAYLGDIKDSDFQSNSYEGITLLETLEHIPDPQAVVNTVCRIAKRFVLISVPSKPDDNPEHIHLFNEAKLSELFNQAGVNRIRFSHVLNHIVMLALK